MSLHFNVIMHQLFGDEFCGGGADVWVTEPTKRGIIVYSFITPFISFFAICGNTLSLCVLMRKEFKASIYTYLSVLATTDLIDSSLLFISGLCRGVLWRVSGWREYEALITLPLGGAVSSLAVFATVAVALDRVVYLWKPRRCMKPKFCQPEVARRVMFVAGVVSVLFNVPYCFMFEWTKDGKLVTSDFFDTDFYAVHNWIKFVVFGIIPAILLIFGNGFLIYCLKRVHSIKDQCTKNCNMSTSKRRKAQDQKFVTMTLVAIVFFFLIGEFPTHLASRKTAVTILFGGDQDAADNSKGLEKFRQIATVLNAVNIAANFIVYCMFCPLFRRCLKKMMACEGNKLKTSNLQVNVFFLGNGKDAGENTHFKLPIVAKDKLLGLFALQDNTSSKSNESSN